MAIHTSNDSRTLTSGGGAVTCLAATEFAGINNDPNTNGRGVAVYCSLKAVNQNALVTASCTVNLEMRKRQAGEENYGSWGSVQTIAIDLPALSGIIGAKLAPLVHFESNTNSDYEAFEVRLTASCTGANVALESRWVIPEPDFAKL